MADEFKVHKLNDQGMDLAKRLEAVYAGALAQIDSISPGPSREKSIAITKLQESSFWAKRSIAVKPENQEA